MKAIKFFAAAVLVSALALSCSSQPDVKVDAELPTAAEVDSVSYLIGVNFGSFINLYIALLSVACERKHSNKRHCENSDCFHFVYSLIVHNIQYNLQI